MRASAATIAATLVFLVAASILLSAYAKLARESARSLRELYDEYARGYVANLRWESKDGRLVLYSSSPTRVLAILAVKGESVEVLSGEFILDGEYALSSWGDRVIVVIEGGEYLVLDSGERHGNLLDGGLRNLQVSSRLLPLLARYLDPADYDAVTRSYAPVNVSFFQLRPGYRPHVSWRVGSSTRYCYDNFLHVHLAWNSSHWVVTYRACAADGPVLDVVPVPRSSTSIPQREWLYHQECSTSSGVRHCFEVYASARGWCSHYCDTPSSSRWHFEVGMRVVYRFEAVDPGYQILVVMNRTTYEAMVGRGCATCRSQLEWAGVCYYCSNRDSGLCDTTYGSWDSINGGIIVTLTGAPRPVFHWRVRYPESLETTYGDDGYELGAWYSYTSVSPPSWGRSDHYWYTATPSGAVSITFYVSGTASEDYLARTSTYQYGYYRILFDLIFDEGGPGEDSRRWDYRVAVFLVSRRL